MSTTKVACVGAKSFMVMEQDNFAKFTDKVKALFFKENNYCNCRMFVTILFFGEVYYA